ncbi:hypothetical protein NMY22_g6340 [Coprinellus aureogranulatus]|nr:hypothetical protein NMY22_g6340 [Coprinellus aureogranulatus]
MAFRHNKSPSIEIFTGAHNFSVEHQHITVSSPPPLSPPNEIHRLLSPISGASHTRNMKRSPPDSTCLPGTRTMLLNSIRTWMNDDEASGGTRAESGWRDDYGYYHRHPPQEKRVVWLCGPVGCGKSAIAQIVAKEAEDAGCLAASFFFFRGTGDRSRLAKLAATLASQMVESFPDMLPHILDALRKPLALQDASIETQFERLVYDPIRVSLLGEVRRRLLIVVDGLDECEDRDEVEEFIDHMLRTLERYPELPLRFFISSRIEEHIREHLETGQVHVMNLRDHHSDQDIATLVRHTFEVASSRNRVIRSYGKWPSEEETQALIRHANGSFIFIRTLLNFILGAESKREDRRTPMERFKLALSMDPGLDGSPFRYPIAFFLGIHPFEVANVLTPLQSIVHVPGDDETRVTLFHTSFREFAKDQRRSDCIFSATSRSEHETFLGDRSLLLRIRIHQDRKRSFPYMMHYWADHWQDAYGNLTDVGSRIDAVVAVAGDVSCSVPIRLAMILFDAQLRALPRKRLASSTSCRCDWLADALGLKSLPVLDLTNHTILPLHRTAQLATDEPTLHRCVIMHLMRCIVSGGLYSSLAVYLAECFTWNVEMSIGDIEDKHGRHSLIPFLRTPYLEERTPPGEVPSEQANLVRLKVRDSRLQRIVDAITRMDLNLLDYENAEGQLRCESHYILYKEDGLSVLDMIHVLRRLELTRTRTYWPRIEHVMVHIGDGTVICFSANFTTKEMDRHFQVCRFNLYADDIFKKFSEHMSSVVSRDLSISLVIRASGFVERYALKFRDVMESICTSNSAYAAVMNEEPIAFKWAAYSQPSSTSKGAMASSASVPPEIWLRIFRLATEDPSSPLERYALGPNCGIDRYGQETAGYRRSLALKLALVKTCRVWNSLATPLLHEHLSITTDSQGEGLSRAFIADEDQPESALGSAHRRHSSLKDKRDFVRRLDVFLCDEKSSALQTTVEFCRLFPKLQTLVASLAPNKEDDPSTLLYNLPSTLKELFWTRRPGEGVGMRQRIGLHQAVELFDDHPHLTSVGLPFDFYLSARDRVRLRGPEQAELMATHLAPGAFPSLEIVNASYQHSETSASLQRFITAHVPRERLRALSFHGCDGPQDSRSSILHQLANFTSPVEIHLRPNTGGGLESWFRRPAARSDRVMVLGLHRDVFVTSQGANSKEFRRNRCMEIRWMHHLVTYPWTKVFPNLKTIRLMEGGLDIDSYRDHDSHTISRLGSPGRYVRNAFRLEDIDGRLLAEFTSGICSLRYFKTGYDALHLRTKPFCHVSHREGEKKNEERSSVETRGTGKRADRCQGKAWKHAQQHRNSPQFTPLRLAFGLVRLPILLLTLIRAIPRLLTPGTSLQSTVSLALPSANLTLPALTAPSRSANALQVGHSEQRRNRNAGDVWSKRLPERHFEHASDLFPLSTAANRHMFHLLGKRNRVSLDVVFAVRGVRPGSAPLNESR